MKVAGKVVALTGGARGIGAATAARLRRAGATVVIGGILIAALYNPVERLDGMTAAIVNDDVELHPYLLDIAYGLLRRPRLAGLVGVHPSCFMEAPQNTWVRPTFVRGFAFGTAMFLRRRDYVPIPEDMKVWCGDDWIFANRPAPAWVVGGLRMRTDMSTTSGSPEFQALLRQDAERWDRHQRSMRTPVSSAVGRALVAGVEAGARRLHLLNP